MVKINFYDNISENNNLIFVDIVAKYNGSWVLCKAKSRDTWECPGGLPSNWTYPYAHPIFIDLVENYKKQINKFS